MKTMRLLGLVVLVLIVSVSCTTAKFSGLTFSKEVQSYNVVGEFETEVSVTEFLGVSGGANLLNITADAMDDKVFDAIQREIQKFSGDAAVNITIEQKNSLVDMVLNSVTGTLFAPTHGKISGTVVKFEN